MVSLLSDEGGTCRHCGSQSSRPGARAALICGDDAGMRRYLTKALQPGFSCIETACDAAEAGALVERHRFEVVIAEGRCASGPSGRALMREVRSRGHQALRIIMIGGEGIVDSAGEFEKDDRVAVLAKPFHLDHLLALVEGPHAAAGRGSAENAGGHGGVADRAGTMADNGCLSGTRPTSAKRRLVGESEMIRDVWSRIERIAPTPTTVLIKGETGTGKELVARALHERSGRSGSYVPVNCGAISADLIEGELFGHLKGAFTGAHQARSGLFSHADGGTLFLDEIGEMPLGLQAKLLRVLEERRFRPVGGNQEIAVNARVIAATNRDLAAEVQAGRFRSDLYYRINVVEISLPPLRDRRNDIPALTRYFVKCLAAELGVTPPTVDADELQQLIAYPWPGNIRELRNVIERSLLLGLSPASCLGGAPAPSGADGGGRSASQSLENIQRTHILNALLAAGGNKTVAARNLGVSRKTVERKLKEWAAAGQLEDPGLDLDRILS